LSLRSISIPKSLYSIGDKAFFRCPKLKDVYYEGNEEDFMNAFGRSDTFPRGVKIHYNCKL
jgi:urate oxidase